MMPVGRVARTVADSFRTPRSGGQSVRYLIAALLVIASPLFASVKLQIRDGRPIVDSVYVNGHGPYRFIVDTGTNVNLIDAQLAGTIGMKATFRVDLASATGSVLLPGSDGNDVELGSARADTQQFLFTDLQSMRQTWPDVQGVLGQWFLSRFDYLLDLRGRRLEFGKQNAGGQRTRITMRNGRTAVSTSLGDLVLDSGAPQLILFGIEPERGTVSGGFLKTLTGSQMIGTVARSLVIEGRNLWRGDAIAMRSREEPGISGLMPLSLFRSIYVCNSEGYVVFE